MLVSYGVIRSRTYEIYKDVHGKYYAIAAKFFRVPGEFNTLFGAKCAARKYLIDFCSVR